MVVKYFIKWEGNDKKGKVFGELPLKEKIAIPLMQMAIIEKVGKVVLKAVEKKKE